MKNKNLAILSDSAYRIDSELGSGGGGVVYKAWHTRLQKHVVIKELKRGSDSDLETQRTEVEALKNVKSPYLPQVLDFITENGRVFTVMEFIEGESFDKLLERGQRFSQPQVLKWYGQLASALGVIHKKNIAHRDIKPSNIMLLPNGDVCLIDFNAALVSGNDVRLISRSLGYASPEQYEIYERYRSRYNAPIHYGSSSIDVQAPGGTQTELLRDDDKTDIVCYDSQRTEMLSESADSQKTELISPQLTAEIDWKLSDIYSLGATMYHLLTGIHPPERAKEVVPVSDIESFSEGIVYIIEQSMKPDPAERFASVEILADAIRNIHKHDTRWKILQAKKIASAIILPFVFALFAGIALLGRSVMAQEKEARYYEAVYNIENGSDAQGSYNEALAIFGDRIGPYRAMAKRLWNDGDIDACRKYIESNLGDIAKFQTVPEAERSFGDIYYILGNCCYYQPGEPDYLAAAGNFEIAVQFVKDNPIYYRDYAISLARTGKILEAERVLEKAQVLNLDADSLNLLKGEIYYARQEYDRAVECFSKVIVQTKDDYMRYRAYHTSDEIFKLQGQPERSINLLADGLNKIPLNRVNEMTERLAEAYVKCGEYDKAIALFEQLSKDGAPQFHILQNLAVLLENQGYFDRAAAVLNHMANLFPADYRVPMRQAYLEANRQSKIRNESRDYSLVKQYYDSAAELYKLNVKPRESDPEMQQLDLIIQQLRTNKWID
jgi:serine/threonine protein kinase/lipopolysaccharide biosynthesis regulator YciM